ncbi:amino acid ABC transporter permease [Stella sp.]|jgi:polar amino acid transport system permease protein|uniref:amino acid ABC transporter permease n=1 Tax=Stella sp. TaxID=2912054 RepID=UPI0035B1F777
MFSFEPGTFLFEAWVARNQLLAGLSVTAQLSVLTIVAGSVVGVFGGIGLSYGPWPIRFLLRVYVDAVRGIPVLVLILFSYYGLALLGVHISPFTAGVVALGGFCGAHMSETVRGALESIPVGQTEAAKAIGLRFGQRLRYVLLPQAIRRLLPPWVNTAVEMVKGTTLLSIIGVVELLLATQQTIARNYLILQFYFAAGMLYVLVNFTISQLGALLERRTAHLRY